MISEVHPSTSALIRQVQQVPEDPRIQFPGIELLAAHVLWAWPRSTPGAEIAQLVERTPISVRSVVRIYLGPRMRALRGSGCSSVEAPPLQGGGSSVRGRSAPPARAEAVLGAHRFFASTSRSEPSSSSLDARASSLALSFALSRRSPSSPLEGSQADVAEARVREALSGSNRKLSATPWVGLPSDN